MSRRRRITGLVAALVVAAPRLAHACAVCFDQNDKNRVAFFATTIVLSALPLGMIGGLGVWLRRRARALRGLPPAEGSGTSPE